MEWKYLEKNNHSSKKKVLKEEIIAKGKNKYK